MLSQKTGFIKWMVGFDYLLFLKKKSAYIIGIIFYVNV